MASRCSDEELLARLVAFDTTSSKPNLPLVDFVCDYLDGTGARVSRPGPDEEPKANLVVELGPETDPESRAGLVLCGHTDVVPAEEPEWTSDPFALTRRGDDLFARGSSDMKGFLALATNLAAELADDGRASRLRAPLVLLFTYDEEVGTLGARHFHDHWPAERPLPRHTVIGEPTELEAIRLHKGFLKLRVTVHGESAHSAYPHLGHNAIEPAAELVTALAALGRELEGERLASSESFPEVPYSSLSVGRVRGGTAINVVPDRCVVELGVRLLPGADAEAMEERLRAVTERVLADERYAVEVLSVSPPLEVGAEAPLYRSLCELLGQDDSPSASYATDAGWLQQMGMDCVLYGPGSIRVAHKPNEHLPAADLPAARSVVERLVADYCVRGPG